MLIFTHAVCLSIKQAQWHRRDCRAEQHDVGGRIIRPHAVVPDAACNNSVRYNIGWAPVKPLAENKALDKPLFAVGTRWEPNREQPKFLRRLDLDELF